ncbi:MAG: flagellar biosynthetic protein FliR [Clostridiales bacterium]|nr:flagellar biosynthetic protein FliR [Clostridiales bacterium]
MDYNAFTAYFLVFVRIASFMYTGIFFSTKGIPNLLKIGFSLILSYIVFTSITTEIVVNDGIFGYSIQIIFETLYGMAIGFSTFLIFAAIQMAGQMIDFSIGFAIGAVYDPVTENKVSIFGKIYYWMSIALFLAVDAHHYMLISLVRTYEILPVGHSAVNTGNGLEFIYIFTDSLKAAFQIALPLLMILFLTDIIMGMLARAVPQINVFILGLPMKVLIGITVLVVLMPAIASTLMPVIESLPYYMDKIIKSLALLRMNL